MKTASWSTKLPEAHQRIGISRGAPRKTPAGYRIYRKLAPGPWFASVGPEEYEHRYRTEILAPLDPRAVAQELRDLAPGTVPVLLCFERPDGRSWCHRSLAAEWLSQALGQPVPEFGHENLPQNAHPLLPPHLRARAPLPLLAVLEAPVADDIAAYIGRSAVIDGQTWTVAGRDKARSGLAVIAGPAHATLAVGTGTLRRLFPFKA